MPRKNTSTPVVQTREPAKTGELTFPAGLIQPQQTQLHRYGDAVTERIVQLDLRAQELATGFGIPFTNFVLNPLPAPHSNSGMALAVAILANLAQRDERISLERRSGRWGLYFTREPAALAQDRKADIVPLKEAPLDVRERFLLKSDDFFRSYLALCADRLGKMKSSVEGGDKTLAMLDSITLEGQP